MSRLIVISVVIGLALFGFLSLSSAQENLTITTYYPSPYGSYMDLRVSDQLSVGLINNIWTAGSGAEPGAVTVSGSSAGLYLVDQNLTAATLSHPWASGQVFYWYNLGSKLRLSNAGASDAMLITATPPNVYFAGGLYGWTSRHPNGCYMMSFGNNSGTTTCPTGTIDTGISTSASSSVGGYFWCCN